MSNLGTLWFGADIDLTRLRQKINQGNQGILDALKMNYDPASYQQMVSKLRSQLANETFNIRIKTNADQVRNELRNSLGKINGGGGSSSPINLSGLKGLSAMERDIINLSERIKNLKYRVAQLKEEWQRLATQHGRESAQAKDAYNKYKLLSNELAEQRLKLGILTTAKQRHALAQRENNRQTREASKAVRQWNTDHMRLNTTLAGGIHISTQLGSALSSLFAIDAARQFLGQVIEIGGQLEKQRISIGAILGDTVKANHLFEQIKGLALQSPFGVVELDQYTKQLSAYGFKYNELFDMTKRLADISAGAGTDIGRLTLALGHVRSATYLTGITLRQFSMNNIPMLKMLADYYTEVEKHAVSTADVQKRISKRQVSYEDVIEQIRRLTNEGGMFYNMQEKISESLAAKYKNLKDAMDIMYGEMAEGSVGDMLKGLASVLLKTTRHWREIADILGVAAMAFIVGKLRIGLNTAALQGNTAATLKQIMAEKKLEANNLKAAATYRILTTEEKIKIASSNRLTVSDLRQAMAANTLTKNDVLRLVALKRLNIAQAMHLVGVNNITAAEIRAAAAARQWRVALAGLNMSLKNAFMGVGKGTWTTIGVMAGMEIYSAYNSWVEKIEGKSTEMKDLIKSRVIDLGKMQKKMSEEGMPADSTALKNRVEEMKQVLANSEAYTKTLDEQITKASSLPEQYEILADSIDKAIDKNRQMLSYQEDIADMIKASSVYAGAGFWDKMGQGVRWFSNDDITQNFDEVQSAYKELRLTIDAAWEYKEALKNVIDEMEKSGEITSRFADQIRNAPFEEQIRVLADSGYWDVISKRITATSPEFANFAQRLKDASNGVAERWNEIANDDIPRMMKRMAQRRGVDEKEMHNWALNNIEDFKMMLDGINDQLGIKEPAIRKRMKRLFYDYVRFAGLSEGLAEGARIGASIFEDENLKKLLGEDEKADLHDDNNGGTDKNGSKKDSELEKARTKLAEYKAFLSEYKKFREIYSKEKAISLLEVLFPNLKGQGMKLVDNFAEELDKLRNALSLTTEARKKWANEVNKTKSDTLFDSEKDALKKNADAMDEYIKRTEDQWKLYRSLLKKSGGNVGFASMAFNSNGAIWDDTAKLMLQKFNQRGKELGVIPVNFRWDMNEGELKAALIDSKGQVQNELVELAQEIQKIITGNYTNFLEDSADAYNKSLTAVQKLTELENQRSKKRKERSAYNGSDENVKKGFDAQIAALDREIADAQWDAFKETEQWGRIFSNLDNISTQTLQDMLEKLRLIAPSIQDSTEGTKALYEAIDKMQETLAMRNPFSAIGSSLSNINTLKRYRAQAEKQGPLLANRELSGILGVKAGARVSKSQINDGIRNEEQKFVKGLRGLESAFDALGNVLEPVVELFSTIGEDGLSDVLGIGSNMFGSAAGVAEGFGQLKELFGKDSGIGKMLGAAGPWGAAAGAALSMVSGIFALHDKALQAEIDASKARQKEMQNLSENLEKALERALGGIYNVENTLQGQDAMSKFERQASKYAEEIDAYNKLYERYFSESGDEQYAKRMAWLHSGTPIIKDDTYDYIKKAQASGSYYDAQRASLAIQRDELQRQMESEMEKKDSDSDAVADYKQQLAELDDEVKNFALDMANSLYEIDIKSWASELTEAIVGAWQKGEDAVDAYKQKVKELMLDLTTNILSQKVLEQALSDLGFDTLVANLMDTTSGRLNEDAVMQMADILNQAGSTTAGAITSILDTMEAKGYIEKGEGESSTSSKIIQGGFSEEETGLMLSYMSAMRADLSLQRETIGINLPHISDIVERTSVLAQTQVTLQEQIASNTLRNAIAAENIYNIVHRIENGTTKVKVE